MLKNKFIIICVFLFLLSNSIYAQTQNAHSYKVVDVYGSPLDTIKDDKMPDKLKWKLLSTYGNEPKGHVFINLENKELKLDCGYFGKMIFSLNNIQTISNIDSVPVLVFEGETSTLSAKFRLYPSFSGAKKKYILLFWSTSRYHKIELEEETGSQ
jgi:hypothetical protein